MINDRIKRGKPVRATDVTDLPRQTLHGIAPGANVNIERAGDQMLVRAKGGPPGGFAIDPVADLPPIPTTGWRFVYWYGDNDDEGGTGDYQVWFAYVNQIMWSPLQFATPLSGIPTQIVE